MRLIPYALYLLLIALHVVILADLTSIYGIQIDLAAFIIIAVALYKSDLVSLWFGFAAGMVAGATTPALIGWYALFGAALGLGTNRFKERINVDSFAARLIMTFLGVYLYKLAVAAVVQPEGLTALWWRDLPASALYTTVVAAIFLAIKHGYLTGRRFKSIF